MTIKLIPLDEFATPPVFEVRERALVILEMARNEPDVAVAVSLTRMAVALWTLAEQVDDDEPLARKKILTALIHLLA
jgi:hypothetical protein